MFEQPPGWTADKERERIRNLAVGYFAAKEELNEYVAKSQKLEDQKITMLIGGVVGVGVCVLMGWWAPLVLAGLFLPGAWIYARRDIRDTNEAVAQTREEMKRLGAYLEEVGLSPHSPWTVEKDGQVLGFVPRYEPKL